MRRILSVIAMLAVVLPTPVRAAQTADRLVLTPDEGSIVTIEGLYPQPGPSVCDARRRAPLRATYRGTLEILRESDGELRIINELSFSQYLRGLAEVPLTWPEAALDAQVIAARSYAMDAYQRGLGGAGERGYHICATDQCQVYRGASVELGPFGERWRGAVRRTRGQVLRYDGRIIQAFYFSTSDGRTRRAFPGGTPQPWLPGVDGEDDDAPLADWTAPVELAHIAAILRERGIWSGGDFTAIEDRGDDVRLTSPSGALVRSKRDLRIDINAEATCLFPGVYPNPTGSATRGRLPQPVPSSSYRVRQQGGRAVFRGSGWGHFVGMSQWGARSLAERGRSARQILKHYYGPAEISRIREPSSLRVLAAEDLRRVRIRVEGTGARITTGTGSRLGRGDTFEVRGGDRLRILRGVGPQLDPILEVRPRTRRIRTEPGATARVRFTLSRAARVALLLRTPDGEESGVDGGGSLESGDHTLDVRIPSLPDGTYELIVLGFDGIDRVRGRPVPLVIGATDGPAAPIGGDRGTGVALAIIALGLAAVATGTWWWRRLSRT